MHRVGAVLAVLLFATPTAAEDLSRPEQMTLAGALCQRPVRELPEGNIECPRARDYPAGESCPVVLEGHAVRGRFSGAGQEILAFYASECEAHVTNFGGAALFGQDAKGLQLKGYYPGLLGDCLAIPAGPQRDQLVCLFSFVGQGVEASEIALVTLNPKETFDVRPLLSTESLAGQIGAETVSCAASEALLGIVALDPSPTPGSILVTLRRADETVIKRACAKGGFPSVETVRAAEPGEGFIPYDAVPEVRMRLSLKDGSLAPP